MQSKSRPYLENRVLDFCLLLGIYYENPPHLSKSTKIFIYFFNMLQSRAAPSVHAPKVSKTCQTKSSKIILNRKRWSGRWWKIAWKLMFSNYYPKAIWQIKAYGRKMSLLWKASICLLIALAYHFKRCFHFQTEPRYFWLTLLNLPSIIWKSFACRRS